MNKSTLDQNTLNQWIGKSRICHDTIDARPAKLMKTIANNPSDFEKGDSLPPLWHWLYFPDSTSLVQLASDGHPQKGGFLPPIDLPRRMWAGGSFNFFKPLRIGARVERTSTIKSITSKQGKTGKLCFVTVCHEYRYEDEIAISEEHDIVYREMLTNSPTPKNAPKRTEGDWHQLINPSPAMLFRYSALTFNAHRIHYDRDYCREVENYPGLVFHGPLTATFLVNLAIDNLPNKQLTHFNFRAVAPLFDTNKIGIAGRVKDDTVDLWTHNDQNNLAMRATAIFE